MITQRGMEIRLRSSINIEVKWSGGRLTTHRVTLDIDLLEILRRQRSVKKKDLDIIAPGLRQERKLFGRLHTFCYHIKLQGLRHLDDAG